MNIDLRKYQRLLEDLNPIRVYGKITQVVGLVIESSDPSPTIGGICIIYLKEDESTPIMAEVVGFRDERTLLMPLGDAQGFGPGNKVTTLKPKATVKVGYSLLGRVLDGLGNPIDGKGPIFSDDEYSIYAPIINPMKRQRIKEPLALGIKAIDGVLTCGKGQRMGIFSASGVGKSILLGIMARNSEADIKVIALIGERGREVKEFIEKVLEEDGLKGSVVVAATSDQPPLIRRRGAFIATTIAEYFRDQGEEVLLIMDSLTRFAMAQREIGLSIGEPPTTKGYTPSVFALLPKLLERAGTSSGKGSITGLYALLVEGDDINEPISDAVRSILDGHIYLSRDLASHGHYPAIDILNSTSRVMIDIVPKEHREKAERLREILATYKDAEDLLNIGAYNKGFNPKIDYAIDMIERVNQYLRQGVEEKIAYEDSVQALFSLF